MKDWERSAIQCDQARSVRYIIPVTGVQHERLALTSRTESPPEVLSSCCPASSVSILLMLRSAKLHAMAWRMDGGSRSISSSSFSPQPTPIACSQPGYVSFSIEAHHPAVPPDLGTATSHVSDVLDANKGTWH